MPKIDIAIQIIIDVAYQLCQQKTVSTVTMQDIIDATGFSQGDIYRFYKDIDEIFQDMLLDNRKKVNIMRQVDEIFADNTGYLKQHIADGTIRPKVSFEELLTYLISSYNGIEMSCIVNHCYKKLPLMEWYTPKTQLQTLETTLYYLLGLED